MLAARFPDQSTYIAGGLTRQEGTASVAVVQQIVDRYAALRDGTDPKRSAARDEDKTAANLRAVGEA